LKYQPEPLQTSYSLSSKQYQQENIFPFCIPLSSFPNALIQRTPSFIPSGHLTICTYNSSHPSLVLINVAVATNPGTETLA
jgi:hypothetical protein